MVKSVGLHVGALYDSEYLSVLWKWELVGNWARCLAEVCSNRNYSMILLFHMAIRVQE